LTVESWKPDNVPVTLHISREAAEILYQYAGERNRGRFVTHLLLEKKKQDELEAATEVALKAVQASRKAEAAVHRKKKRR